VSSIAGFTDLPGRGGGHTLIQEGKRSMSEKDLKAMYRTRTEGEFPATFSVLGRDYEKVEDLRYGTNPHQPAAFYVGPGPGRVQDA